MSKEVYLCNFKYGHLSISKATVRETPKMYIVEEYEAVVGNTWWLHRGAHKHKEQTPAFDSLYDSLVWGSEKLHGRRDAKRKEVFALTKEIEMLEEMIAAL